MPTYVTRPWLPDIDRLQGYIAEAYQSHQLTNNGPLMLRLTARLEEILGVTNLLLVSSGTMALQIALKLARVGQGEVVTTPFTFPATSSAILWQGAQPVYADILPTSFNVDPKLIRPLLSDRTEAILATHVFGNPSDVVELEGIGKEKGIPLILDAAQSFGVNISGTSVLSRGDISVLSFHATKLFHTLEGGALILKDEAMLQEAKRMTNFGLNDQGEVVSVGINGKMNEFEAAMGLAVLDDIDDIFSGLSKVSQHYDSELTQQLERPEYHPLSTRNHSYYPVVFPTADLRGVVQSDLEANNIYPRQYFYPSLDTVKAFAAQEECPVSRDLVERILCLPIYATLDASEVAKICRLVNAHF